LIRGDIGGPTGRCTGPLRRQEYIVFDDTLNSLGLAETIDQR
jgi:hypothetical protein